ncbi:MAG: NUDIX domain-containing protein [Nitrospira sp.]
MLARETEGERQVPDVIWNLPHFQSWLQAQKNAGNRLDGFKPVFAFPDARPFFWGGHVNVFIGDEGRNKINEVVLSRPDIMHIVLIHKPLRLSDKLQAVMVREFRSPASTPSGFILETPGGSSVKGDDPLGVAVDELYEETGVRISPERLVSLGSRQLMGTMSAHKAHVYGALIGPDDMDVVRAQIGRVHGNAEDSERTYVEVHDLDELLNEESTDWSTLGMLFAAVSALGVETASAAQ